MRIRLTPGLVEILKAQGHDVSHEARDQGGKWSRAGGGLALNPDRLEADWTHVPGSNEINAGDYGVVYRRGSKNFDLFYGKPSGQKVGNFPTPGEALQAARDHAQENGRRLPAAKVPAGFPKV